MACRASALPAATDDLLVRVHLEAHFAREYGSCGQDVREPHWQMELRMAAVEAGPASLLLC